MALKTLGTIATDSLYALPAWSAALAAADIADIGQSIANDAAFASILSGGSAGPTAVKATGASHSNTTLDTLVVGVVSAPLAQIQVGDLVIGGAIAPGTFVTALPTSTSVTLSKAALATASPTYVVFIRRPPPALDRNGILTLPGGRGQIKLLPGDIVAIDNLGWVIVVSGASISYTGSFWDLV